MEQPSQPQSPPQPQRRRLTAEEVRKNHAIYAAITTAMLAWFVRDAWFNPDPKMQEHLLFNKSGSLISSVLLIFFATMAISAHLSIRRQKQQKAPASDEAPTTGES